MIQYKVVRPFILKIFNFYVRKVIMRLLWWKSVAILEVPRFLFDDCFGLKKALKVSLDLFGLCRVLIEIIAIF